MNRDRHEQEISVNQNSKEGSRNKSITPNKRPSRARGTEAVTGKCKICGSNSWDTDAVRGETICAECGYVAAENMIEIGRASCRERV